MKASELVTMLQNNIKTHGDWDVVSGVHRSGYGEPVIDIFVWGPDDKSPTKDMDGNVVPVFDLELSENSKVEVM